MDTCKICGRNLELNKCHKCALWSCKPCLVQHNKSCDSMRECEYHLCQTHHDQVSKYCCDCHTLICQNCFNTNHKGHESIEVNQGVSRYATAIQSLLDDVTEREINLTKYMRALGVSEQSKPDHPMTSKQYESLQTLEDELNEVKVNADCLRKETFPIVFLSKLGLVKRTIKNMDSKMQKLKNFIQSKNQTKLDVKQMYQSSTTPEHTFAVATEGKFDILDEEMEADFEFIHKDDIVEQLRLHPENQVQEQKLTIQQLELKLQEEIQCQMDLASKTIECISEIKNARTVIKSRIIDVKGKENHQMFLNYMKPVISITANIKNDLLQCEQKVKEQQSRINELELKRTELNLENSKLKTDIQEKSQKYETLFLENEQLSKSENKFKNQASEIRELKQSEDNLRKQYVQLQNSYEENRQVQERLLQENERMKTRLSNYQETIKQTSGEMEFMRRSIKALNVQIDKKEEVIQELKHEKDDLQTRLSSIAGEKLTKSNPSVTDLSDPNRPMKIGDKYGELYDNEWTDALECSDTVKKMFPDLEKVEIEEVIIHHLYRVLMGCYKTCLKISKEQVDELWNALGHITCMGAGNVDTYTGLCSLSEIQAFRRQNAERFIQTFLQNKVLDENSVLEEWSYNHKNKDLLTLLLKTPFYEKCVNLCWAMVIQDPVMYLDDEIQIESKYDKNIYKEFLKSGDTVQFVVWPSLFLHKGGPLLFKGVVQAYMSGGKTGTPV